MSETQCKHNIKCVAVLILVFTATLSAASSTVNSSAPHKEPEMMTMSDEAELVRELLRRYEKQGRVARPVINSTTTVKVRLSLMLYRLINVDESEQFITVKLWLHTNWSDQYLVWNPEDYGGIRTLSIPPSRIWTPDIEIYNSVDTDMPTLNHQYLAQVDHNGLIVWSPPAIVRSECHIDMRRFPFDDQTCNMTVSSWTYDNRRMDLDFEGPENFDVSKYIDSNEWSLVSSRGSRHVVQYFVGHAQAQEYTELRYSLTIGRRVGFYVYALIVPSVLLSFLMPLTFWIPSFLDSIVRRWQNNSRFGIVQVLHDRPIGSLAEIREMVKACKTPEVFLTSSLSQGMSLFSSFFVLLLVLIEASPTSASVSNLGMYYCYNMITTALLIVLSVIVLYVSDHYQDRPVPPWARKVFNDVLSRLFLSRRERDSFGYGASLAGGGTVQLKDSLGGEVATTPSGERIVNQLDWSVLIIVIDRVFFTISITAVVVAILIFFPR